jgi:hypothetical protein
MYSSNLMRNYTITNQNDQIHIENGRCPNYALLWNQNNNYWPKNHDYFIGNGSHINDGTKELREILSERSRKGIITKNLLFCDLDGVLTDFDKSVEKKFDININDIKPTDLWNSINKSTSFFENLPWMPKGKEFWEQIKKYNPIILTGIPPGSSTASEEKKKWCQRELGSDISVITCLTKDKSQYCFGCSILIDDNPYVFNSWKEKGGKCILYEEDNLYTNLERIEKYMKYDILL